MVRPIASLLVLLLVLMVNPVLGNERSQPASITVVADDNYPPYLFRDDSGKLDGYLVDLWALWQRQTGVRVHLVATSWADALAMMAAGDADVIDTIFRTDERATWLDFTPPYTTIPVPIFVHASIGGIADTSTLQGFLVGVKAGDACTDRLAAAGIDTLQPYPSYSALIQAAVATRIKVFCLDEPPAEYLLYRAGADKEFRKAFTLYTGQMHRAVRKGDRALLQLVERGFAAIPPAEVQHLHDKWMGTPLIAPWVHYLVRAFSAVLLVGAVLVVWGVLLRRQVAVRTRELENERARLRTVLSTLPDLVWLKDLNGVYQVCNSAFERFFGAREADILGRTDCDFVEPALAEAFHAGDVETVERGREHTVERWLTFADGSYRGLFQTTKTPLRDARGDVIGVLGIAHDITALTQSREALDFLAHHDPLTRLPNRLLLRDRLEHAIARAERDDGELAILFVDLDRFKNVNDALGHLVGDDLLREVAHRMAAQIRAEDTLARVGGDEFILLIEDEAAPAQVTAIAEKLLALFAEAWAINQRTLFVGASIGISRYPVDGSNADELIKRADMAMYRAKSLGRNTYRFFESTLDRDAMERMLLENMLRGAVARQELLLLYQPQIDMTDGRLVGVEALVRWQHPELGLVPPQRFIPIAEEIGIIAEVGDWVIRESCRQLVQWRAAGMTVPRVSINLSVQQIERQELADDIGAVLREYALVPADIELEVTESLLMRQAGPGIAVLDAIDSAGIRLSVDDFGTGYSSLSYLRRMPVSCLKIDRSFTCDIGVDGNGEAIVHAIIALTQSLSMDVIAEGVETEAQAQFLRAAGCRVAQGYLYGRPLAADEIARRYR